MNINIHNWPEIHQVSRNDEYEADYTDDQNNSNTGYNEDLLKYELIQAEKEKEYRFEHDYDSDENRDFEINDNEKYATD